MLAHGKSAVYVTEGKYSALFSSLKQLRDIIHRKPFRSRCLKIRHDCPWLRPFLREHRDTIHPI